MFAYRIINSPEDLHLDGVIIDAIFEISAKECLSPQKGTVNIVFEDDVIIRRLNRDYRQKDFTTDVLSFHYHEDYSGLKKSDIAGEMVLSHEELRKNAEEYGIPPESETYKLIIHSVLHLLGYDHESEEDSRAMEEVEGVIRETICGSFGLEMK